MKAHASRPRRHPRVCIIGMGLMGGSLGMALVRQKKWRVVGVDRKRSFFASVRAKKAVHDATADWRRAVSDCDIVVVAVPVDRIVPWVRKITPFLAEGAFVMDVGSVKGEIAKSLEALPFVGAHPMTGSEKSGVAFARPDLYRGAVCVITPAPRTPEILVKKAESFWSALGARAVVMRPDEHDRWAALVSHLPHLLADALILAAFNEPGAAAAIPRLAAGSFKDMTRVAGADPDQWAAIFRLNSRHLKRAAARFREILDGLLRRRWRPRDLRRAASLRQKLLK